MINSFSKTSAINPSVVAHARGDVNGDRIPDYLYLTAVKTPTSPFFQQITLIIQDGRTAKLTRVALGENAGYNPRIFLGDFTGDRVKDILISIDSGGSGAIMYHYIYTFVRNIPQLIFDFDVYNAEYGYQVSFRDNYKVEAISRKNNSKYIIDISLRDPNYLHEIYNESGILKEPIEGFVNPLSGLYPVDFNSDGVYELLAYQKIAGRYNADSLGYFLNTLSWKDNKFGLYNQNVAIEGFQP